MESFDKALEEIQQRLKKIQQLKTTEEVFQQKSEERFSWNLEALKVYYPNIYQQVIDYKPRSEFKLLVAESGDGNFVPKDLSVPLYSQIDPKVQVREQVKHNILHPCFGRAALYKKGEVSADKRIHIRFMHRLSACIAELTAETTEPLIKKLPKHFPSLLNFGIGLGYHLPILLKEHVFDYIFLCEPDFELFYASLFCTDWKEIFEIVEDNNSSMFMLIGISYQEFFQKIIELTAAVGAFSIINSFCYQHYPSEEINRSIADFFRNFYQIQLGFGFYNDAVNGLAHAIRNSRNNAHFFIKDDGIKPHKGIPAFVVGNGPSLDESIELIREHQDKVIIFAAGTALQSLMNAGIKPDFHVIVERTLSVYQVLTNTTTDDMMSDMNLLSVEVVYPDTLNHYKWAGLGLKGPEASTVFMQMLHYAKTKKLLTALPYAGPLVSNTAATFACELGFDEVYLFGVDNGYPTDKSKSHSSLSIYSHEKYAGRYRPNPHAIYPMEGNLGGTVLATDLMAFSKAQLDNLFLSHKGVTAYKVGSGAKLRGVTPLAVDDVIISSACKNKKMVVDRIKSDFFHKSEVSELEEKLLAFTEFDNLIAYLLEIGNREINSRKDAAEVMKAQSRVVFSYKDSLCAHLFHVLKGTLLYFHCPLITLLYTYENDEKTLAWFKESFSIWMEFLQVIRSDFPENWYNKCEYKLWVPPTSIPEKS